MTRWGMVLLVAASCTSSGNNGSTGSDFGRAWSFTIESATITPKMANGDAWDADGSAPDPFARVSLDGALIGTTPTLQDTLDPVWSYATNPVVIQAGRTLSIDLIDSDVLSDDTIFVGCALALTEGLAMSGGAACTSAQATLQVSITIE